MFNNTKALGEDDKKFGDYTPYKAGSYIFRVGGVELGETAEREWRGSGMVETGRMIPQLTVIFDVFKMTGSNEIDRLDGSTMVNARHRAWINDSNLGWNKKENKPKDGRAILAALYNVAPDAELPIGDPSALVNKKLTCYLTVETKKDSSKNKMIDIIAYLDAIPGVDDLEVTPEMVKEAKKK